jgi:hypothetical protein
MGMMKNSSTSTAPASAKKKISTTASAIVAKKKSSTASAAAAASTKKSKTNSAAVEKKKTSKRSSTTVAKKSATTASDVLTSTSPTNRTLRSASRSGYTIQWTPSPDNNKKDACTQTPENIPERLAARRALIRMEHDEDDIGDEFNSNPTSVDDICCYMCGQTPCE